MDTEHQPAPGASEASAGSTLKPIVGTGMSRFLGQYNPQFDQPYERPHLNQGAVLLPELTELLEADRKDLQQKHHRRKDDVKSYMDECVRYQSVTKQRK